MPGDGAGRVRDLGQLRPVQRPLGDDAEHPARRQQRPDLVGGQPETAERPVRASRRCGAPARRTRHQPSRTGQTSTASSAASGAPSGSVSTSTRLSGLVVSRPATSAGGHLQRDRDGPASSRRRAGRCAGCRRGRPGCGSRSAAPGRPMSRSSRSANSCARGAYDGASRMQLLGQHPPVHDPPSPGQPTVSQPRRPIGRGPHTMGPAQVRPDRAARRRTRRRTVCTRC